MVSSSIFSYLLTTTTDEPPFVATLEDLEDPINTSDRAPLTGNISSAQAQQNSRTANNTQGYLNSVLPGEDRRAPMNTIDESVWETLKRDLLAVWEKMRQVLYPKYLLGGVMARGGGIGGAEREESGGLAGGAGALGHIRGLVGRWPDADTVLQGGMSEGLRDWDLWGPLLFCLLLSLFLSINARDDQRSLVFSGVFATVWLGEAIVTLQIKLLGGNMLHTLSAGHRFAAVLLERENDRAHSRVQCTLSLVSGRRRQHSGRKRRAEEPRRFGSVSAVRVLHRPGLFVLHFMR
nr:protein yipf6 like [Quercus suber]